MDSKRLVIHIIGLLAWVVLISSKVSARVFTETFSNTKKDVDNINENKVSYGNVGYGNFGGVYPGNGGYLDNGDGYYEGYPNNGGFYQGNGGYGGGYPINGGGYPGNGGYGGGYPGNFGGNNGNDLLGNIGGIIGGIVGNIGGLLGGRRGGAAVVGQAKDNTRN
ncbi:dormancy-associated protein 2-like [Vicia villosa]|uniref:dormancy-associated protein 2-like n=1 Tax=Vicia villosa TaxID=3911 RepID=UPI00273CA636|nr:dormancy-associated protein 2-like [Vicia villosa]